MNVHVYWYIYKRQRLISSLPQLLSTLCFCNVVSQSLKSPDLRRPAGFKDLSISALTMVGYRALLL